MPSIAELFGTRLGELAALAAALCWVFTSLSFAAAGRRIGPVAVNLARTLLALGVLACLHRWWFERWWPELDATSLVYLGVSGIVGLAIGDQFLFTALVDVGSRLATLLMTLAPPAAALLAWPILDEPLGWLAVFGILVTVAGIGWVVMERPEGAQHVVHRHRVRGMLFGMLAGICQAGALVLAKLGMGHARPDPATLINPWSATLVRMAFAAVGISVLASITHLIIRSRAAAVIDVSPESEHLPPGRPRGRGASLRLAFACVVAGTILGPVVGVWLSMEAVHRTDTGVAATLMAMSPVFILPFAAWLERERITWRATMGVLVAVAGVVLLAVRSVSEGTPPEATDTFITESHVPERSP